jgi:tRNA (Thr-GGU) A37 N-methylase
LTRVPGASDRRRPLDAAGEGRSLRIRRSKARDDETIPLTGVFRTRSSDRSNPVGVHRVTVTALDGTTVHVDALEAIDGTPIVDLKVAMRESSPTATWAGTRARGERASPVRTRTPSR